MNPVLPSSFSSLEKEKEEKIKEIYLSNIDFNALFKTFKFKECEEFVHNKIFIFTYKDLEIEIKEQFVEEKFRFYKVIIRYRNEDTLKEIYDILFKNCSAFYSIKITRRKVYFDIKESIEIIKKIISDFNENNLIVTTNYTIYNYNRLSISISYKKEIEINLPIIFANKLNHYYNSLISKSELIEFLDNILEELNNEETLGKLELLEDLQDHSFELYVTRDLDTAKRLVKATMNSIYSISKTFIIKKYCKNNYLFRIIYDNCCTNISILVVDNEMFELLNKYYYHNRLVDAKEKYKNEKFKTDNKNLEEVIDKVFEFYEDTEETQD